MQSVDVLIFGGGIAGLWALHELRAAGYDVVLADARALGHGQSIQAQGIIHGGGKYALRRVGDVEAVRAIRDMPDRWRRHLEGAAVPDLGAARLLSPECWLWLPRGSWSARLEAWGLMPLLRHGGLLACPPRPRPPDEWPRPLSRSALRAYAMAEPVLDTASVLEAMAGPVRERLLAVDAGAGTGFRSDETGRVVEVTLRPRDGDEAIVLAPKSVVFTAGAGNEDLLRRARVDSDVMQSRPLRMFLVRGALGDLHAHCVSGGRTRVTVTSTPSGPGQWVWQVGGEIAEREADGEPGDRQLSRARAEVERVLPGIDLSGCDMSSYRAVRAEGRRSDHRRPSGVQLHRAGPNLWAAWPTKWALAPLLAAEIVDEVRRSHAPSGTERTPERIRWPRPEVAAPPWEEVEWTPVVSVARN